MKLCKLLLMLLKMEKVFFELLESMVYEGRPYAIGSMGRLFMVPSLGKNHSCQALKKMNS